jgi:hypothetical protein
MRIETYELLNSIGTFATLLTLVVGIGLSLFAMQRGRPALLALLAFAILIVGILSSGAAVGYVTSRAIAPEPKYLALGAGSLAYTLSFVVAYVLIFVALFGPKAGSSTGGGD